MDPKELRGLMEAYSEVYAPQEEIEEGMKPLPKEKMDRQAMKAYKKERSAIDRRDDPEANRQMQRRIAMQSPASRRNVLDKKKMGEEVEQIDEISAGLAGKVVNARIERTGAAADRENKARTPQNVRDTVAAADKEARARKLAAGVRKRRTANEEVDIFDVVLEFLYVEGYAETLEEAEWMMANLIDEEAIDIILGEEQLDEAEGSYGQTPKARTAMGKLAIDRMRKPASEYSQRGEKTKKLKAAEKHTRRQDTLSQGKSGGKKSSRPWAIRGKMNDDDRSERRAERAFDGDTKYGAGSVTKNPKKLRKQKAMGEISKESFEAWLDEAMTNYEKNRKRAAQRAAARNDARAQGKTGAVPGVGYVTPRKERETWTDESGKTRHAKGL